MNGAREWDGIWDALAFVVCQVRNGMVGQLAQPLRASRFPAAARLRLEPGGRVLDRPDATARRAAMRMARYRRSAALFVVAGALVLTGCFEQPVRETMYLKFIPGREGAVVAVTVRLGSTQAFEDNAAARARIAALQRDLLDEHDPWSRRFRRLEPLLDRVVWDRTEGSLAAVTRRAYTEDPQSLRQFFSDSLIDARVAEHGTERELTLVVGSGSRASRSEREDLREGLSAWMDALARYLHDATQLYGFLERNRTLAPEAFSALFDGARVRQAAPDHRSGGARTAEAEDPREQAVVLAHRLEDSMGEVLLVLQVSPDSGRSLEELSWLVYDPLPAPLTVEIPGKILEVEGFRRGEGALLEAGGEGLLKALQALEGKWVDPDPLLAEYRALKANGTVDAQAFARRPRRHSPPPSPSELRDTLERSLSGPKIYRVRWDASKITPDPRYEDPEWLLNDPAGQDPASGDRSPRN